MDDARDRGEAVLPAVRRLHLAARHERADPGGRHRQRRDDRRRGVLPARPHGLPRRPSSGSSRAARTRCSTPSCRPGSRRSSQELHDSGFSSRGGHLICTYFDENFLNMVPAAHVEGLYGCLDYYQAVDDPFSRKLLEQYDALYPGDAAFTGGSGCSGLYRGLRLWAGAVAEAGSLEQDDVIAALDHAELAEGPGGPAAVVPGQHHLRMNMYIAQARGGRFEIVRRPRADRSAGAPRRPRPSPLAERRRSINTTEPQKGDGHDPRNDAGRGLRPLPGDLLDKGADKRREHGSKGVLVFRDPVRGRPRLGALRLGRGRAGRAS